MTNAIEAIGDEEGQVVVRTVRACDSDAILAVIDDGRVVHQGSMEAFAADPGLQDRLLGLAI